MRTLTIVALAAAFLPAAAAAPAPGARKIYMQRCEPCHATDGSGSTPMGRSFKMRDLRSPDVQNQTDAQIAEVVSRGRNGRMPAFGESLGPDNIRKVVAYLRTLKQKPAAKKKSATR